MAGGELKNLFRPKHSFQLQALTCVASYLNYREVAAFRQASHNFNKASCTAICQNLKLEQPKIDPKFTKIMSELPVWTSEIKKAHIDDFSFNGLVCQWQEIVKPLVKKHGMTKLLKNPKLVCEVLKDEMLNFDEIMNSGEA